MVILTISILRNFIGIGILKLLWIVIQQQRNDTFGVIDQQSGIEPFVEIILHIGHLTVTILVQPIFKSWRLLLQKTCFRYTARQKSETFSFGFDKLGMFCFSNNVLINGFALALIKAEILVGRASMPHKIEANSRKSS